MHKLKIQKIVIFCLLSVVCFACSKNDYTSYCPTWYGFTYTIGDYPNYVQGNPRNVVLNPGDSIHITACQKERGHLINATKYSWTICYDTLDTKNNEDPNDDVIVHVRKTYYDDKLTNYDGYSYGADDPVCHMQLPSNVLPTEYGKSDTIMFVARYVYSGQGVTIETGNIINNTSYNGRITPQSGPTGGGAAGNFYFSVVAN